jgi:acyl-CoA synthetase (AMP-forming)/AMP-acid ligase II
MMNRLDKLFETLRGYDSLPCMEGDGRRQTYADLLAECEQWHQRLAINPGTVVALRADYSLSATAALLAMLSRGAIVAMLPRDKDVRSFLADACATELLEIERDGTYRHERLADTNCDHPLLDRMRVQNESGVVVFTSGSTGKPKAAVQSTERFLAKFAKPGRRFRTLGFLRFDHIAGLDTLFYSLASGGALILARQRDPETILALIDSHRVEVLPASPSFLRLLCLAPVDPSRDLSSLKIITYGSEPMDPPTLSLLNRRFPNLQISQKYGTTETGSPRSISRGNDSLWIKLGSGVETRIVAGTLWLRSEGTILGYLNAPSPVDEDGWYNTGDLVDVDGEWIRFRGRESDVINVGGEKVAPAEVEQTILELPFVESAVVEGEKNALMGQIVTARVSLTKAARSLEAVKLIRSHCAGRLARYKIPVKIDVVETLLVNDRQKKTRTLKSTPR